MAVKTEAPPKPVVPNATTDTRPSDDAKKKSGTLRASGGTTAKKANRDPGTGALESTDGYEEATGYEESAGGVFRHAASNGTVADGEPMLGADNTVDAAPLIASARTGEGAPEGDYRVNGPYGTLDVNVSREGSRETWSIRRADTQVDDAPVADNPDLDDAGQWLSRQDAVNGLPPQEVRLVGDDNGGAMRQFIRGDGQTSQLDRLDVLGQNGWETIDRQVLDQLPSSVDPTDNLPGGSVQIGKVEDRGQTLTFALYDNAEGDPTQVLFAENNERIVTMVETEPGVTRTDFGPGADDFAPTEGGIPAFDGGTIIDNPDGSRSAVNAAGDIRRNYVPDADQPGAFTFSEQVEHLYVDGQPTNYRHITDAEGQARYAEKDPATGELHPIGTEEEVNGAIQWIQDRWGEANDVIDGADEDAEVLRNSDNPVLQGIGHLAGFVQDNAGKIDDWRRNNVDTAQDHWRNVYEGIESADEGNWGTATVAGGARIMEFLAGTGGALLTPASLMNPDSSSEERLSGAITTGSMGVSAVGSRALTAFGRTSAGQAISRFLNRPIGRAPVPSNVTPLRPGGAPTSTAGPSAGGPTSVGSNVRPFPNQSNVTPMPGTQPAPVTPNGPVGATGPAPTGQPYVVGSAVPAPAPAPGGQVVPFPQPSAPVAPPPTGPSPLVTHGAPVLGADAASEAASDAVPPIGDPVPDATPPQVAPAPPNTPFLRSAIRCPTQRPRRSRRRRRIRIPIERSPRTKSPAASIQTSTWAAVRFLTPTRRPRLRRPTSRKPTRRPRLRRPASRKPTRRRILRRQARRRILRRLARRRRPARRHRTRLHRRDRRRVRR